MNVIKKTIIERIFLIENLILNIRIAKAICKMAVNDWVIKAEIAAPRARPMGIKIKFKVKFVTTPANAIIFNCFKLPLAVSKVPKI